MRLLTQPGLVVRDGALRLLTVRVLASCRLFGPHPEERLKAASRRMGRAKSAAIHPHSRGTNARVLRPTRTLENQRAQGKPDARSHPQPRVRDRKQKAHE